MKVNEVIDNKSPENQLGNKNCLWIRCSSVADTSFINDFISPRDGVVMVVLLFA